MKTLTKLSAKALNYYINVRRWKTDLDFFDTEVDFINQLENAVELLGLHPVMIINGSIIRKLTELMLDKEQVMNLFTTQLSTLETLAEGVHAEQPDQLSANQAQLEYQFNDLIYQFRDIKGVFYKGVGQIIAKRKELIG